MPITRGAYPEKCGREPATDKARYFACANVGKQLVSGNISKPADIFEGRLGEREGGSVAKGPGYSPLRNPPTAIPGRVPHSNAVRPV